MELPPPRAMSPSNPGRRGSRTNTRKAFFSLWGGQEGGRGSGSPEGLHRKSLIAPQVDRGAYRILRLEGTSRVI